MPFEPIRRLLPQAVQAAGIREQVTAARVLKEAEQTIKRLWGEEKAGYVRAISFTAGTLKLGSLAPAALQELKMDRVRIQNEINRAIGEKSVKAIMFISLAC